MYFDFKCIQNVFWPYRTSWLILTDWYPQIPTITLTWTDKNYLLPPKKDIFETLKKTTTATENFSSSSTFILKHFNFHHQQTSLKREQFQPSSKCLNQVTILKTCLLNIFLLQLQSFLIFRLRILKFEQNSATATQIIKKLNPNWSTTYFCKMCKMSSSEKYISSWFCFFYKTTNFRDFFGFYSFLELIGTPDRLWSGQLLCSLLCVLTVMMSMATSHSSSGRTNTPNKSTHWFELQ